MLVRSLFILRLTIPSFFFYFFLFTAAFSPSVAFSELNFLLIYLASMSVCLAGFFSVSLFYLKSRWRDVAAWMFSCELRADFSLYFCSVHRFADCTRWAYFEDWDDFISSRSINLITWFSSFFEQIYSYWLAFFTFFFWSY